MSEATSIQTISTVWPLMSMPEDVRGVLAHLVDGVGELDATGLAPTTDLHLRLDHDRELPDAPGGGDGVVDRGDGLALRHGNVEGGEELLPLVLEEVHPLPFLSGPLADPSGRPPGAGATTLESWVVVRRGILNG